LLSQGFLKLKLVASGGQLWEYGERSTAFQVVACIFASVR